MCNPVCSHPPSPRKVKGVVPASLASRVIRRVHHGVSVLANKARFGDFTRLELVEYLTIKYEILMGFTGINTFFFALGQCIDYLPMKYGDVLWLY